jgi:hypothetical protein
MGPENIATAGAMAAHAREPGFLEQSTTQVREITIEVQQALNQVEETIGRLMGSHEIPRNQRDKPEPQEILRDTNRPEPVAPALEALADSINTMRHMVGDLNEAINKLHRL